MSHTPPPMPSDPYGFMWPILIGMAIGMLAASILLPV